MNKKTTFDFGNKKSCINGLHSFSVISLVISPLVIYCIAKKQILCTIFSSQTAGYTLNHCDTFGFKS